MVAVWVVAAVYAMKMFVEWDMSCVEVVSVHRFFMSLYIGLSLLFHWGGLGCAGLLCGLRAGVVVGMLCICRFAFDACGRFVQLCRIRLGMGSQS